MIRVNLPHMDAAGLSEGWLFRHSGNLHWDRLCAALGTPSHELTDDRGTRLYPVFVAIRARYDRPLAAVTENEELDSRVELAHYGRAFFRSLVNVENANGTFALEMVTTFAARQQAGQNDLHRTTPASRLHYTLPQLPSAPGLLLDRQALKRGLATSHSIAGHVVGLEPGPGDLQEIHEPSPYADFNGVGLLYFAAYPVIVDTVERRLLRRVELEPLGADWALATSTVARDIFYYRNVNLGDRLVVTLNSATRVPGGYLLHSIVSREHDAMVIADVITLKRKLANAERRQGVPPHGDVTPALAGGQVGR